MFSIPRRVFFDISASIRKGLSGGLGRLLAGSCHFGQDVFLGEAAVFLDKPALILRLYLLEIAMHIQAFMGDFDHAAGDVGAVVGYPLQAG